MIREKRNKIFIIISYACAVICVIALLVCAIINVANAQDNAPTTPQTSSSTSSEVPEETPGDAPEVEVPEPDEEETQTDKLLAIIIASNDIYSTIPYSAMITADGKLNEDVILVSNTLETELEAISTTIMTYLSARDIAVITNEVMQDDTLAGYFNTFKT